MGAKNCPETPRQKMIGMMYLVLTAMLALNVSADVLDAFAKVQQGLNAVISSTKDKNEKSYNDISAARILNPKKMEPVCVKTDQIQKKSKEVYDFIESLKQRMVKEADGISIDTMLNFNTYDIQSKSNLDIAGQIMLKSGEGQGEAMKNKITEYRELLKTCIDPIKGKSLLLSIDKFLNTDDRKELTGGGSKPWEVHCFESIPLVGVVTLMTLYQSNILTVESDAVKYLVSEVDAESFKFNKLEAKIIPKSNYVLRNGDFEAEVMLIAIDTTKQPDVIIGNKKLPYVGNKAIYTEHAAKIGSGYKVEGNIKYVTSSGREDLYPFSTTYDVGEPQVVISATKMNVFYLGVDNPVTIAAPGFVPEELKIALTNGGSIKPSGAGYIVRPVKEGTTDVVVSVNKDEKISKLGAQTFRVKRVPDPVAKVGTKKAGDKITKNEIIAAGGVSAILENFDFDMKFEIVSFNVFTIIDGYIQDAASKNSTFTGQQRGIIQKLRRGQIFGVEKIMAKGPDGVVRNLPSISYRID